MVLTVFAFLFLAALVVLSLGLASLTVKKTVSGIMSGTQNATVTGELSVQANPTLAKGQPGSLTTRTSNSVGTITMTNAGHGITTGARVDLYWTGGSRYGVTVGTVSGLSVPFTVGSGDNLPSALAAVTVSLCNAVSFPIDPANLDGLAMSAEQEGYFVFVNGDGNIYAPKLAAGRIDSWLTSDSASNPLGSATAAITILYMSTSYETADVVNNKACAITD